MLRHHRSYTDVIPARARAADVGLSGKEDELASNLSHGEQRISRSASRWHGAEAPVLDEPTAGMSVAETHATVIWSAASARDLTISHRRARHGSRDGARHTITVLNYGEVLPGTAREIQANRAFKRVYLKI